MNPWDNPRSERLGSKLGERDIVVQGGTQWASCICHLSQFSSPAPGPTGACVSSWRHSVTWWQRQILRARGQTRDWGNSRLIRFFFPVIRFFLRRTHRLRSHSHRRIMARIFFMFRDDILLRIRFVLPRTHCLTRNYAALRRTHCLTRTYERVRSHSHLWCVRSRSHTDGCALFYLQLWCVHSRSHINVSALSHSHLWVRTLSFALMPRI